MKTTVEITQQSFYTDKKIQNELLYHMAEQISNNLLAHQLISHKEWVLLRDINLATFPPLFKELLPKKT